MWTAQFWKDLAERAIVTFFQVFIVAMGTDFTGTIDFDWGKMLIMASLTALASVAKSLVSVKVTGNSSSASLAKLGSE